MNTYYSPSGGFSPMAFINFVLISLIAFPLLGFIYAYAIWYIPFIYINFLIAAGFGFAIGFLIRKFVITNGKLRNPMLAMILSVLGGFIALYFHWVVWVDLVLNAGESIGNDRIGIAVSNIKIVQVLSLAANPGVLFELIGEINEYGTWGIRTATVSGVFLTIIWLLETVIIVGVATIAATPASRKPFCEMGNKWFDEELLPSFNFITDHQNFKSQLESGNADALNTLVLSTNSEQDHSAFTLFSSDYDEAYLTVENVTAKLDDKGKIEYDNELIIEHISLSPSMKKALSERIAYLLQNPFDKKPETESIETSSENTTGELEN